MTVIAIGMIIIPVAIFVLPADYFDNGPTTCLITIISGQECPACGMTRACIRLAHFRFEEAWFFNPLSFIAFPILAFQYAKYFLKISKQLLIDYNIIKPASESQA